jgi:predicted MFS family arabinose efflux permease
MDRRRLLIAADVARALLFGAIPVVWLFASPVWLLYVLVPLAAVFSMLFSVTYVAVIPRLVPSDQITQANGMLSASYATAGIAGPLLAGVISAGFGPAAAIAVDAATFVVSAIGIFFVRFGPPSAETAAPAEAVPLWRNLLVGARFLGRHPVLRSLTAQLTLIIFVQQGLVDVVIFHVKHDLGGADSAVGGVLAVAALGTIAGSLAVAGVRKRLGFGATWIGMTMLTGAAIAAMGFGTSVAAVAAIAAVSFFATAIAGLCSMSLRQQVTPDALLGRVTSAYWTIHSTLGPAGAAVLTAATAHYGVRAVLLVAGVAYMGVAAAGLLTPIRLSHPERIAFEGA